MRWGFNLFPAYRGTGGWITYIASDYREVRVRLPLSWRTRNIVGTIYGGSLYGVVDPIYMIMLIKILGPGYTVWDKAATIRFLKPGRSTLTARFLARRAGDRGDPPPHRGTAPSVDRVYEVTLTDAAGVPHAVVPRRCTSGRGQSPVPSRESAKTGPDLTYRRAELRQTAVLRPLVVAQAQEHGLAELVVGRPLLKRDLGDELRRQPDGALFRGADRRTPAWTRASGRIRRDSEARVSSVKPVPTLPTKCR